MNRRHFIKTTGLSLAGVLLYDSVFGKNEHVVLFTDPDRVTAIVNNERVTLIRSGKHWKYNDVIVTFDNTRTGTTVYVQAPNVSLKEVTLSWNSSTENVNVLNDHWERTYGDVSWHAVQEEEFFPWYFMQSTESSTFGTGVKTGASTFCQWHITTGKLELILDTRSGGNGVKLGSRKLKAAELVSVKSTDHETAFQTAQRFMKAMCDKPRMPKQPVYGINDWYFSYGNNSSELIMEHTRLIAPMAEGLSNKPFSVIDDGWFQTSPCGPDNKYSWGDDMKTPNKNFPDMHKLAGDIRDAGMRPGLWMRPLSIKSGTKENLLLPLIKGRYKDMPVLDPSIPENLALIKSYFNVYKQWGFELVKFDYTSWDIFGQWGFQMMKTGMLTPADWSMYDVSKTNAEIINTFYQAIREAAGNDIYVIGCNTFSHLSAGLFELNRIGDDTSGNEWDRTRKMGVNTLAFRGIHHGAFYAADADCVGLTTKIPWEKNAQWLELVAKSGTPLFISAQPEATGSKQKEAIKEAFQFASKEIPLGEPLDWKETPTPSKWKLAGDVKTFDWS